jgi:hypothetical protein
MLILRIYAKKSKRITFSHTIISIRELTSANNHNHLDVYQTGLIEASHAWSESVQLAPSTAVVV